MARPIGVVNISSKTDAIEKISTIANTYSEAGLVVLRGTRVSEADQVEIVRQLGDIFDWNVCSTADDMTISSSIYQGGHSDIESKDYSHKKDDYVLDWHIEQVYYIYPILAGVWNMTKFTAQNGHGNTRFVDSVELFKSFSDDDQDFLTKSTVIWRKPSPSGEGPYYTKVVDSHPLSGLPTLRLETDQGCYLFPELYAWNGESATEEQKTRLKALQARLKDTLNSNEDIRYVQEWQEGDILIVDLFRMYHAVMGGFSYGERMFTGMGIRPKNYDNSMYTEDVLK